MAKRAITTYARVVTELATLIAGAIEPGIDGEVSGIIEIQNLAAVDIEISNDRNFAWGQGQRIAAGTGFYQDSSPDPYEWYALRQTAGSADVRIHDTRRPKGSPG